MDRICALFRILGNSLHLEETLASFDDELHRHLSYAALSLHVVENERVVPAYVAGADFAALAALECAVGEGLLGGVIETRRPAHNCRPERLGRLGTAVALPLEYEEEVSAVWTVFREGWAEFSPADLAFLIALAPILATTVGTARAFQTMARLAGVDPLTGALNGRSLFLRLDAELARSRRRSDRLAVLECDIQGLDPSLPRLSRGVLHRIAGALRGGCREYDVVAYNGEDFVLVLPGLAAVDLAQKPVWIQTCVEQIGLSTGLPLAAFVGAASFPADATDTEGLLAVAAQRLKLALQLLPGGAP